MPVGNLPLKGGEVDVRLFGDLETVLAWAEDKEVGFRSPATLFLRAAGDGLSVPASDRSCAYPPSWPPQERCRPEQLKPLS